MRRLRKIIFSGMFILGCFGCHSKNSEPISMEALKTKIEEIIQEPTRAEKVNEYFVFSYQTYEAWKKEDLEIRNRLEPVLSRFDATAQEIKTIFNEWQTRQMFFLNQIQDNVFLVRSEVTESEWKKLMKENLGGLR